MTRIGDMIARAREGAAAYLATLDPTSLALCRCTGTFSPGLFPHVGVARGPNPLREALLTWPRLSKAIVALWSEDPDAFSRLGPERAIEAASRGSGVPDRLVASVWEVDQAIGRLSGIDRERVTRAAGMAACADGTGAGLLDEPLALVRLCAALPPSWVPATPAGWDAFLDASGVVALALQGVRDRAALPALLNARGDWPWFAKRLRSVARDASNDPAHEFVEVSHVAEAMALQLVLPADALASGRPRDAHPAFGETRRAKVMAEHLVRGSRSVSSQIALSASWHRRAAAMRAAVAALPHSTSVGADWAAGLPDMTHGVHDVRILVGERELLDEGARGPDAGGVVGLSHCVGGHAHRCRAEGLRVASIGTWTEGRRLRLSTAALRLLGGRVTVVEHRGRGNARPPPEAEAILGAYLDAISSGLLRVDPGALAPVPHGPSTLAEGCGYEWWAPGAWETVRDLWAPFLPRALRNASPAELGAATLAPSRRIGGTAL